MIEFFKRLSSKKIDENEVWAEWYQSYFEIYCSNCHKEAEMKSDCSDYIYSKRCPHCNARMRNATRRGYNKAIRQYEKKNKK